MKKICLNILFLSLLSGSYAFANNSCEDETKEQRKVYISLSFSFEGENVEGLITRNDNAQSQIAEIIAKNEIELLENTRGNIGISRYHSHQKVADGLEEPRIVLYSSYEFQFFIKDIELNQLILDFEPLEYATFHYSQW